jgi:hypothetical protein
MRILVVGGVGYLGSIVSDKLMRSGEEVDIFDLCLFDNSDVVKDLYKGRNPNNRNVITTTFDGAHKLLASNKYDHIVWCSNIDVEGFYDKFANHAQQTYNFFDSLVDKIPMSICLDYKNSDHITHYMHNKSMGQNTIYIPSLYGPSLRMRWDTVINKTIFAFMTEKTVLLGQNWMNKVPICRVAEMAQVVVDGVHGVKIPYEKYLEGYFSILELVFIIKNCLDSEDTFSVHLSQLVKEINAEFSCKIDHTVQQSTHILEETVVNIKEQLTNGALPDFWNDKYNDEAVLLPIMRNLEVLERLNG